MIWLRRSQWKGTPHHGNCLNNDYYFYRVTIHPSIIFCLSDIWKSQGSFSPVTLSSSYWGVPRSDGKYDASNEFWVYYGVSSKLDKPGIPPREAVQEASWSVFQGSDGEYNPSNEFWFYCTIGSTSLEPPQMAPTDMKEHWLYSKRHLNVWWTHPINKA